MSRARRLLALAAVAAFLTIAQAAEARAVTGSTGEGGTTDATTTDDATSTDDTSTDDTSTDDTSTDDTTEEFVRIERIEIEGLERTSRRVVERELMFDPGERVAVSEIEESVQRLRNLDIFETAEYRLEAPPGEPPDGEARILHVVAEERWTLLPTLRFVVGGDATRVELGLYDLNFLGQGFEVGGKYRYVAGTHSSGVWYRDPRFLEQFLRLDVELWRARDLKYVYRDDGALDFSFIHEQDFVSLDALQEWTPWAFASLGVRISRDDFATREATGDDADAGNPNRAQDVVEALPVRSWLAVLRTGVRLGRLDTDSFLVDGQQLDAGLEVASTFLGAEFGFVRPSLSLLFFRTLPLRSTFGVRLSAGLSTADHLPYFTYHGGLESIRGYANSRFLGRGYWGANVELRVPSIRHRWVVLQHVGFADALEVGDDLRGLLGVTAVSAGVGLRLIVPRVYGLVLRFDYAWTFVTPGDAAFNFGSLQFF